MQLFDATGTVVQVGALPSSPAGDGVSSPYASPSLPSLSNVATSARQTGVKHMGPSGLAGTNVISERSLGKQSMYPSSAPKGNKSGTASQDKEHQNTGELTKPNLVGGVDGIGFSDYVTGSNAGDNGTISQRGKDMTGGIPGIIKSGQDVSNKFMEYVTNHNMTRQNQKDTELAVSCGD